MPGVTLDDYLRKTRPVEELVKGDPLAEAIFNYRPAAPTLAPPAPTPPAPFKRGVLGAGADLAQSAGVAGNLLGAFDFAGMAFQKAQEYAASRDAIPRRVGAVEDIQSLGDVGVYAYETLAENAPNLLAMAIPAGAAGLAARALGGTGRLAAGAAGFLTDVGLQTGESSSGAQQVGGGPAEFNVVGTGLGKAMLDFVPVFTLARQLGLTKQVETGVVKELVGQGYIKRSLNNAKELIATEVPTEVAQQAMDIVLQRTITNYSGSLTDDEKSQLLNAGAGAATFGLLGFVSGIGGRKPGQSSPPPQGSDQLPPQEGTPTEKDPKLDPLRFREFKQMELDLQGGQGEKPGEQLGFDFAPQENEPQQLDLLFQKKNLNLSKAFDPKTGQLLIPQEDYKQALIENSRAVQYDPAQDDVKVVDNQLQLPLTRTGWTQVNEDLALLDYNGGQVHTARGMVQKQAGGTWGAFLGDGTMVGEFKDPEEAKLAALQFSTEQKGPTYFSPEGKFYNEKDVDPQTLRLLATPPEQRTPTENISVEIEKRKQRAKNRQQSPKSTQKIISGRVQPAVADPGLQKLLQARTAVLADPEMRRTKDGELRLGGTLRLKNIDTRIQALTQKLGVENPITGLARPTEEAVAPAKPIAQEGLSATESALVTKLEEKDLVEGLSDNEFGTLEKLYAKRQGEEKAPRVGKAATAIANLRLERFTKKALAGAKELRSQGLLSAKKPMFSLMGRARWEVNEGAYGSDVLYTLMHPETRETLAGVAVNPDGSYSYGITNGHDMVETQEPKATLKEAMEAAENVLLSESLRGSSVDEVSAWIRPLWNSIKYRPATLVIARTADADVALNDEDMAWLLQHETKGAFWPDGRLGLFPDNIHNKKDAILTLLHELMHFGLASMPPKYVKEMLRAVYRTRRAEVSNYGESHAAYQSLPRLSKEEIANAGHETLYLAEEFLANFAERVYSGNPLKPFEVTFKDTVINLLRRWIRVFYKDLTFTDKEMVGVLKGVGSFLREQNNQNKVRTNPTTNLQILFSAGAVPRTMAPELIEGMESFSAVWGAKAKGKFLTPIQYAERSKSEAAQAYMKTIRQWWTRKRTLADRALESARRWEMLGTKEAASLGEATLEIEALSNDLKRQLKPDEIRKIIQGHNVGEAGFKIWQEVDGNFRNVLDHVQKGLEKITLQQFAPEGNHEQLLEMWRNKREDFIKWATEDLHDLVLPGKLAEIESQFDKARNKNYFPHSRFGKYALTVRAGKNYPGAQAGTVVAFETYESYAARKDRVSDIVAEYSGDDVKIEAGIVKDEEFALLGMPPILVDTIGEELGLTKEQQFKLKELYITKSPGQKFMRHFLKRRGVKGFSRDLVRAYSSYMTSSANHIAKLEYQKPMQDALGAMRKERGDMPALVFNYFNAHYKYISQAKSELAALRSIGFLFYLGFNVKSALVNLTQVPMVAYPFLASKYGDKSALGALSNAYGLALQWKTGKAMLDNPALLEAIQRGIAEGFLDESRATELAALGEAGVLERVGPATKSEQALATVSRYGAAMFKHAEVYNRAVTFIAARELALSNGATSEQAFEQARKAVDTTMFEYAKWNRPEFMRGNKSVVFLFWNYMQHLSYLIFGGEGKQVAMRTGLMLLVAAGMQGLPFASNILDLLDWGGTEMKEHLGMKNPKVDLRQQIRELAMTITDKPDLVLDGLGKYYGLGPMHALALAGVPVPEINIAGSLSAGRVIPGLEEILSEERDPNAKLGKTLVELLGPVAGIGFGFFKAMESDNPDTWKNWERAMPSAFKAASAAVRRGTRGQEVDKTGNPIAAFQWENPEQRGEIVAQALGFQGTRLSQQYEIIGQQKELAQYWTARRAIVMENYALALLSQDQDVLSDAKKALDKFNDQAPVPKLRVTGKSIHASMMQRTRLRNLRAAGLPAERAFAPLYSQIQSTYPSEREPAPLDGLAQ